MALDQSGQSESLVIVVEGSDSTSRPVSYSAFTSWLSCGKQFQLERILEIPAVPGWYFVGGSAVHTASEGFDRLLFQKEGR